MINNAISIGVSAMRLARKGRDRMTNEMQKMAETVAKAMIRDGVAQNYIDAFRRNDGEETGVYCEAYMAAEAKKTEKMQTRYMTDKAFRADFQKLVMSL